MKVQKNKELEQALLKLNTVLQKSGIELSLADIQALIQIKDDNLQKYQRMEFHNDVIEAIILKFSQSQYIGKYEHLIVIEEVMDIFYYIKAEVNNLVTDEALIDMLYQEFEFTAYGSLIKLIDTMTLMIRRLQGDDPSDE